MNTASWKAVGAVLLIGAQACQQPSENSDPPGDAFAFSDAIQIIDTVSLEENPEVINVRLEVAADGNSGFVIADRAEGQVRTYDRTGRLTWFGGGKGGGPGEFTMLSLARRMPDGTLLCAEWNSRFTVFDTGGDSIVRTIPTDFFHLEDIDILDDETLAITAMLEMNHAGPRIHLWDLHENRVTSSFFSPFEKARNKTAATFAGWTRVSRRGDSLAVVFATSDTVFVYSRDGSEARKLPLPSGFFRRVPEEEPRRRLSDREQVEWISTFDFVTDVWWLSSGNFLVQYQSVPPDLTLNDRIWHLVAMDPSGNLLAEVRDSPRAFSVDEGSGLVVFQDPGSIVPGAWIVGKPSAW